MICIVLILFKLLIYIILWKRKLVEGRKEGREEGMNKRYGRRKKEGRNKRIGRRKKEGRKDGVRKRCRRDE
jgi:hypothetical protein